MCLAETHKDYPDALPELVPMFTGIIATTQRQLLAHLLDTEADWPWAKQPTPR